MIANEKVNDSQNDMIFVILEVPVRGDCALKLPHVGQKDGLIPNLISIIAGTILIFVTQSAISEKLPHPNIDRSADVSTLHISLATLQKLY